MIIVARPNLGDEEIRELEELIAEYEDVFATQSGDNGRTGSVPQYRHRSGPTDSATPKEAPLAKRAEANEMLEDMPQRGVIEESDIPWSSPVVVVRKKNGELRICVDYRKLNDVTRKDCFPLSRMDYTLSRWQEPNGSPL
jgi:hypothetical protein